MGQKTAGTKAIMAVYWVSTILLVAMLGMGVFTYATDTETVMATLVTFGYPGYLVYVLGTTKVLGLLGIFCWKSETVTQWAYAGLFYILSLGLLAHLMVGDGQQIGAIVALVLLAGSFVPRQWMMCGGCNKDNACSTKKTPCCNTKKNCDMKKEA